MVAPLPIVAMILLLKDWPDPIVAGLLPLVLPEKKSVVTDELQDKTVVPLAVLVEQAAAAFAGVFENNAKATVAALRQSCAARNCITDRFWQSGVLTKIMDTTPEP